MLTTNQITILPVPELEELIRRVVYEEINGALQSSMIQDEEFLTREELAKKLKKTPKTISKMGCPIE